MMFCVYIFTYLGLQRCIARNSLESKARWPITATCCSDDYAMYSFRENGCSNNCAMHSSNETFCVRYRWCNDRCTYEGATGVRNRIIADGTRNVGQSQRDGRPAEYRWCPLFNPAKFDRRPLLVPCSNAAKRRNPLKFAGAPQTRQQILVASAPKFTIFWGGHVGKTLLFNKFFYSTKKLRRVLEILRDAFQWCSRVRL